MGDRGGRGADGIEALDGALTGAATDTTRGGVSFAKGFVPEGNSATATTAATGGGEDGEAVGRGAFSDGHRVTFLY